MLLLFDLSSCDDVLQKTVDSDEYKLFSIVAQLSVFDKTKKINRNNYFVIKFKSSMFPFIL